MNKSYQVMDEKEILEELNTSMNGLTTDEVLIRKEKYGINELPKKKKDSIPKIFIMQFANSITVIMIVAAILSFIIHEVTDAVAIVFIIMVDAIMGTIQEWRANKSAEALADMIKAKAQVIRNGKEEEIDASELTVGDIVLLQSGVKVSADARILNCNNLTVEEAVLTGESLASYKNCVPIEKEVNISDAKNMVFAGTSVITGRATAVITSIGSNTEIGKIATRVINTEETPSPLTIRMAKFTKQVSALIVGISIILLIVLSLTGVSIEEIFMTVVGLAVSAMPEGLPLALTLALTIGSSRMGKRNVIVKKLNAVESLGSCTVIASDKTGTLTVNEQTAKKVVLPNGSVYEVSGTGYNDEGQVTGSKDYLDNVISIAELGTLNNEAGLTKIDDKWNSYGDSIDIAFLALGKKLKVEVDDLKKLASIPYESENKYSAVFFSVDDCICSSVKGSVETVFEFCDSMMDGNDVVPLDKKKILEQNERLASDGYRVIALAAKTTEKFERKEFYQKEDIPKLVFLGLVAFIDPIRKEVKDSIDECKTAGIKVVMVTGDHPLTAFCIAKELGLTSNFEEVATGTEIEEEFAKGKESFDKYINSKRVFTRVTPIQKLEIVEAYKRNGEFVAVTGDGVNDAPAIKAANIGIAMGSGSDVAKETSNMIIIDDNFKSIVAGIEEGRNAYANIRKVVYMLISCGFAEVLFFTLSIAFGMPIPLAAVQLLWLNLVTDGLQDLALSFEKGEKGVMKEKPRDPKESLFDKLLIQEIVISGLFIGLIVFAVWIFLLKVINMEVTTARGYVMALMVFMQNIHVFNCRSEKESVFKIKMFSNWFVPVAVFSSIFLQVLIMEVPFLSHIMKTESISWDRMLLLLIISLPILLIMEVFKSYKRNTK